MVTQTQKEKKSETIRRIIDAATEAFAAVGFAGARVDEIAKKAGVNKAMIYYHIGDKEALYAEVLHEIIGDIAERITRNIKEDQSPEEKLRMYIRNLTLTVELHPHMPSIMMREIASGGRNLPEVVAKDFARILGILTETLGEGAKKGVFIQTNPFIIHMMVVGAMAFYKTSAPIRAKYGMLHEYIMDLDRKFPGSIAEEIEKLIIKAVKR